MEKNFLTIVIKLTTQKILVGKFMVNQQIENHGSISLEVIKFQLINHLSIIQVLGGAFYPKQLDQFYKLFSSTQNFDQFSSAFFAYKRNFLNVLVTTSWSKFFWSIDSSASDHMTNANHLFISYSPSDHSVILERTLLNKMGLLNKKIDTSLK